MKPIFLKELLQARGIPQSRWRAAAGVGTKVANMMLNHGYRPAPTNKNGRNKHFAVLAARTRRWLEEERGITAADLAEYGRTWETLWENGTSVVEHRGEDRLLQLKGGGKMLHLIRVSPEALAHFGLRRDPLDIRLEGEDHIYLSAGLKAARAKAEEAVKYQGFVALYAPIGGGKTTLKWLVKARLSLDPTVRLAEPKAVDMTALTPSMLTDALVRDWGAGALRPAHSLERRSQQIYALLAQMRAEGLRPAVIIDEAHRLAAECLARLKALWDAGEGWERYVGIVLIGQPPLAARLLRDEALTEVTRRCELVEIPMPRAELADYYRHLFRRVGGDADRVFTKGAYGTLGLAAESYLHANSLAALALNAAHRRGEERVTVELLESLSVRGAA